MKIPASWFECFTTPSLREAAASSFTEDSNGVTRTV